MVKRHSIAIFAIAKSILYGSIIFVMTSLYVCFYFYLLSYFAASAYKFYPLCARYLLPYGRKI